MSDLIPLLQQIENCTLCEQHLPLGPRPVVRASASARILIIGQAPGSKVHASGIPWDDASGKRLREWLQTTDDTFYDASKIAIMPMGFCYPGKGKSGDLPPRPECAQQWHQSLLEHMPNIELTLLIGQYAQQHYLRQNDFLTRHKTLTERVKHWQEAPQGYLPLPHPSPRNQIWLKKNPWFEQEVVSHIRSEVQRLL
ncbi:uracil-DNA glycosylase family protein [Bacterioplanoides sp.]|uniref:uracil-DNA glycosylase family protein n=1 Tax=Bacterioplanoides sp. TaxID=2066072 RepID=UPI003AFFDD1D